MYIHAYKNINGKEAVNLKEQGEEYGRNWREEGKEEMM